MTENETYTYYEASEDFYVESPNEWNENEQVAEVNPQTWQFYPGTGFTWNAPLDLFHAVLQSIGSSHNVRRVVDAVALAERVTNRFLPDGQAVKAEEFWADKGSWGLLVAGFEYTEEDMKIEGWEPDPHGAVESVLKTYEQWLRGNVWHVEKKEKHECNLGHEHEEVIDQIGGVYADSAEEAVEYVKREYGL